MPGKEVLYETFYTKAPGQDRLRKTAAGRLKNLLRDGWHEVGREQVADDAYRIRFEREGVTRPLPPLRTKPEPPPRRRPGDRRGPGGPRGGGGYGGPRGGPRGGGPPQGGRGPGPGAPPGGPPSGPPPA
ncbi:MAG: hypothetical protein ACRDH8_00025 [Actinomycetota bacterium]